MGDRKRDDNDINDENLNGNGLLQVNNEQKSENNNARDDNNDNGAIMVRAINNDLNEILNGIKWAMNWLFNNFDFKVKAILVCLAVIAQIALYVLYPGAGAIYQLVCLILTVVAIMIGRDGTMYSKLILLVTITCLVGIKYWFGMIVFVSMASIIFVVEEPYLRLIYFIVPSPAKYFAIAGFIGAFFGMFGLVAIIEMCYSIINDTSFTVFALMTGTLIIVTILVFNRNVLVDFAYQNQRAMVVITLFMGYMMVEVFWKISNSYYFVQSILGFFITIAVIGAVYVAPRVLQYLRAANNMWPIAMIVASICGVYVFRTWYFNSFLPFQQGLYGVSAETVKHAWSHLTDYEISSLSVSDFEDYQGGLAIKSIDKMKYYVRRNLEREGFGEKVQSSVMDFYDALKEMDILNRATDMKDFQYFLDTSSGHNEYVVIAFKFDTHNRVNIFMAGQCEDYKVRFKAAVWNLLGYQVPAQMVVKDKLGIEKQVDTRIIIGKASMYQFANTIKVTHPKNPLLNPEKNKSNEDKSNDKST
eukprot:503980_1